MQSAPPSQPEDENRDPFEALAEEFAEHIRNGGDPSIDGYLTKYPELAEQIEELFPLIVQFEQPKVDTSISDGPAADSDPNRGKRTDDQAGETQTYTDLEDSAFSGLPKKDSAPGTRNDGKLMSSSMDELDDPAPIEQVGRYAIKRLLGVGGFGRVYLAFDEQLQRSVAIKMPSDTIRERIDTNEFIREARIVAQLEHPAIVPVYDVGEEEGRVFIVSRFIGGMCLSDRIAQRPLTRHEAARIVEQIAEGLHFAHSKGLVHRDIKPANILLEEDGTPFLTDFGIALSDQDLVESIRHAGTPRYMSPEQARGEGHLIDGRSDIFSLGIVLHELLTGVTPFRGKTPRDVMKRIVASRARPLRQFDATIPVELERICLRALAKHASDRYSTAYDLAEDLRAYLAESNPVDGSVFASVGNQTLQQTDPSNTSNTLPCVVPKGLVAFDRNDADFFLQLLPGPFDRMGMPDSIRFWKHLIECRDPDQAVRVGTVYGPSGCGKSSLICAGVLPRLESSIDSVLVSASANLGEGLLRAIERKWPELKSKSQSLGAEQRAERLTDLCIQLRRDIAPRSGRKVVLVIDQFEQYLHSTDDTRAMADALRHCDGVNVQAILMVRIDYWLGLSRFMQQLEPRQLDATNSRMVDLFDRRHARNVLKQFGRAYGALPGSELSEAQNKFLDDAIDQLQTNEKVIAVRLSLFAEMIKGKRWEPSTLRSLGGVEGIGLHFLDESLGERSTNPDVPQHRKALRDVLSMLLPDDFSELKGDVRSTDELLRACGYEDRPSDFQTVLHILDTDLRLITPVAEAGDVDQETDSDGKSEQFQLSHDFLVPAIRDWLTLQQRATASGRARLSLEEHARLWKRKPSNPLLPNLATYSSILARVPKNIWNQDEREMMEVAGKRQLRRLTSWAGAIAVCVLVALMIQSGWKKSRAQYLTDAYLSASTTNIPVTLERLKPYLHLAQATLRTVDSSDRPRHVRATLALLQTDADRASELARYMLETSDHTEFEIFVDQLATHPSVVLKHSWTTLEKNDSSAEARLNAASAIAKIDGSDQGLARLAMHAESLAEPLLYGTKGQAQTLHCVGKSLTPGLWNYATDSSHDDRLRRKAVELVLDYSDVETLIGFLLDARREHLSQLIDYVAHTPDALTVVKSVLPTLKEPRKIAIARLAAHRLGEFPLAFPAFQYDRDPIIRSYYHSLVHLFNVDIKPIFDQLDTEENPKTLQGLVVALAECGERISPEDQQIYSQRIKTLYRSHSDSGVHGACEYLLRKWGVENSEKQLVDLQTTMPPTENGTWYVNPQGQTFSVVTIGEFQQGSDPKFNPYHLGSPEILRTMKLNRTIAIGTTPVTHRQYDAFQRVIGSPKSKGLDPDSPINQMAWFNAAAYCNWLSRQEGLPPEEWCYEPRPDGTFGKGMKIANDSRKRTGYRLPTAAEWEYCCRAGQPPVINRYYGTSDELLAEYAWHGDDRKTVMPVGLLRPNDIGLFDMLGNVHEWTSTHRAGKAQRRTVLALDEMICRGGSYATFARYVRDTCMYFEHARVAGPLHGFRIVRTLKTDD